MKKFLCILLSGAVAISLLSGCSKQDSTSGCVSKGGTTTIKFTSWAGGGEKDALQKAINNFNSTNKEHVEVKADFTDFNDYSTKIDTLVAGGTPPDIGYVDETLAFEWGSKGTLKDLDPYFQTDASLPQAMNIDNFVPGSLFKNNEGKIYGIGLGPEIILMFYNKKSFQDAGIAEPASDPKHPWTWDQMLAAAKKLTTDQNGKHPGDSGFNKNKIKTYGIQIPTGNPQMLPFVLSNDAFYFSNDGKQLTAASDGCTQVFQAMGDLMNKYSVAPSPALTKTMPAGTTMLENGQISMMVDGQYTLATFGADGFNLGDKIDVAPVPIFKTPENVLWSCSVSIFAGSKNQDAAWSFLKYLADPETNIQMYQTGTWVAPLKSWYTDPSLIQKWVGNPLHGGNYQKVVFPIVTDIAQLSPHTYIKNWNQIITQQVAPVLDQVWNGTATAKDALEKANVEKTAQPLLEGTWQ